MAARSSLMNLKETKLTNYAKGTSWNEYFMKLMSAAETRSRMVKSMNGDFMMLMNVPEGGL